MDPLTPVEKKLVEARELLRELDSSTEPLSFYRRVNAFLSAARSILYVLRYQCGWADVKSRDPLKSSASPGERQRRQSFDDWYDQSPDVKAVLDHRLSEDRHQVIHRSGQSDFVYHPPGISIEPSTPFKGSMVMTTRGGMRGVGIPVTTEGSSFSYQHPDKRLEDAFAFCRSYLGLLELVVSQARKRPWI